MVDPQVRSLQRARGARSELLGLAEGLQEPCGLVRPGCAPRLPI